MPILAPITPIELMGPKVCPLDGVIHEQGATDSRRQSVLLPGRAVAACVSRDGRHVSFATRGALPPSNVNQSGTCEILARQRRHGQFLSVVSPLASRPVCPSARDSPAWLCDDSLGRYL